MNRVVELYRKYGMQSVSRVAPIERAEADFPLGSVSISRATVDWLGRVISTAFNASGLFDATIEAADIARFICCFYDDYLPAVPSELKGDKGSTSDDGLLCNWLLLHAANPDCYVESGVYIGASLRLADVALPNARKWAYDLSFRPLLYKSDAIAYIANEWSQEPPDIGSKIRAFAFFDDHIDPVKRIVQCHEHGIEWVLFDDSPSLPDLHWYRYPAVPSVQMILDDDLSDGVVVEWLPYGKEDEGLVRYKHDTRYCQPAKELISAHIDMRRLFSRIGLRCGDKVIVRLRRL